MITTCTTCGKAYEAGSEEQANEPTRFCAPCWSNHKAKSKRVFSGPFLAANYIGLPGDRILFVAHDPHTGICCPGRDEFTHAEQDAQALNAAYTLGKNAGREERDAAIHAAYEQVRMTAIPGGSGHLLVPDTAIGALRSALYPKGGAR